MDKKPNNSLSQDDEVRKGPWTMEEDLILINYIANHGEGVWNSLARSAGLKRTGKSCRLRWLNYLRPDVRRGNITAEEELLIMELHAKWGNRWSKIAKHLPGRTDNEIKNYWRTRIQKHLRQTESTTTSSRHEMSPSDNQDQACVNHMSISAPNYASSSSSSNHQHEPPYLPSIPASTYTVDGQVMEASTTYNNVMPPNNMHPAINGDHFWQDASEEELCWSMQLFNGYN